MRVVPLAMMLVLCVGDRTNTAHKLSEEHIQALSLEDDRCQSSEKTGVKYCVSSGKGEEWQQKRAQERGGVGLERGSRERYIRVKKRLLAL